MKLTRPFGASTNATQMDLGSRVVLFSYGTPVAVNVVGEGFYKVSPSPSVTTTRHINKWLNGANALEVSREQLEWIAKDNQ